jgi:hypothetical protein
MTDSDWIMATLPVTGFSVILLAHFDLQWSAVAISLVYLAALVVIAKAIDRIRSFAEGEGREAERKFYREHDLLKPRSDPAWAALRESDNFNEVDPAMTEKLLRALGDGPQKPRGPTGG